MWWKYYDAAMAWFSAAYADSWTWINGLNRPQWLIMLVVTTVLGFLCLRGFGSRKSY